MNNLTSKQKLFIYEYLIDRNATQAAIRAGYSEASARQISTELMAKPEVKEVVDRLSKERLDRLEVKGETVLKRLDEIGGVDIGAIFDDENCLKPIKLIPPEIRRCIASVEVYEHFEDGAKVGETKKIKFHDKVKSNELLGKNQKLWTEKIELTDKTKIAEKMALARKRASKK